MLIAHSPVCSHNVMEPAAGNTPIQSKQNTMGVTISPPTFLHHVSGIGWSSHLLLVLICRCNLKEYRVSNAKAAAAQIDLLGSMRRPRPRGSTCLFQGAGLGRAMPINFGEFDKLLENFMCACSRARVFSKCFRVFRASVCIIMADLTPRKRHEEAQSVDDEVRPPSPLAQRIGRATPRKMKRAEVCRKWRFAQGEAHTTSERSRKQSHYSNLSFTQKQRKVERNREGRKLTRAKETWAEQAGRLSEQEQVQIMQLRSASDQWDEILDLSEISISRESASSLNAYTGLRNLGNTCYLNVILQAFLHCLPFREAILHMHCEVGTLARSLQRLMHQFLSEQWAALMPLDTVTSFFEVAPEFHDGRQHDAAEAFGMLFETVPELQMPCRSLALTAQGGVILATLPPAVVSSPEVSWRQLLHEALKGDAQPRTLPKVLVIAFCNIYEFAEAEHFVNCNVSDVSTSVEVSASVAGSIGDVAVVPERCFYSVRVAVHHVAGAVGDDSARPSTRRTAGHYRSHIRQSHRWYVADDSIVKESPDPLSFFPRLVFLERSEELMGNRLLPHCSDDVASQFVKKRPAMSDNVAKKRPAMLDGALPAQKRAREQSEDGREHADVASASSSVVPAASAAPQRDNTRAQDRSGRDQCGRVQDRSGRKQIRELSPRARRVDVVDIRDLPLKRYMQHLACP